MGVFRKSPNDRNRLTSDAEALMRETELAGAAAVLSLEGITRAVLSATESIEVSSKKAADVLHGMAAQSISAMESVRYFCDERGINRPARKPNRAIAAFVLTLCLLLEGTMGAALFFADGKAPISLSLAYGLSIAGINIFLCTVNGLVFGRALGFMIDAPEPKLRHVLTRIGAWGGFLALVAGWFFLGYAASRVQVTGDPRGIFDFSEFGPFASLTNYYGILLIVLGLLGGIIAMREGWSGFLDPIVGYSEVWERAEIELREAAQNFAEQTQETLEANYAEIAETAEEALDDAEERITSHHKTAADLKARTLVHNQVVRTALANDRDAAETLHARQERIKGRRMKSAPFDASPYDALIHALPDLPPPNELVAQAASLAEARQQLESTYQGAVARTEQAFAVFATRALSGEYNTDEEGEDDV